MPYVVTFRKCYLFYDNISRVVRGILSMCSRCVPRFDAQYG